MPTLADALPQPLGPGPHPSFDLGRPRLSAVAVSAQAMSPLSRMLFTEALAHVAPHACELGSSASLDAVGVSDWVLTAGSCTPMKPLTSLSGADRSCDFRGRNEFQSCVLWL